MNMITTPAYFITVFSKCETNDFGWLDTGDTCCWGFYYELDGAIYTLHNNLTDLREYTYDYAIIEKYYPGISQEDRDARILFKWDEEKQGFYEIPEPDCMSNVCSFSIG